MITKIVNILTILRVFLALIIFGLLMNKGGYLLALILFFLAGMSDYFDGYFARKYNATSQLGEILDPIADKILILFIFFALSVNLNSYLIAFMGSIIVAREIWVSALRDHNARNYKSDATKVTYLAKIKTAVQLFTITIYLFGLAFNMMLFIVLGDIFIIIASLITIYTGYIYTVNTFK
jgi:CDP-diacylglycerol--glycerol-3-phosphate 3-phosphatidyltransferase